MSEISVVGGMEGVERARNVIDGRCASKDVDEGVESDKTGSDSGLDCSHHDSKTQSESETQDKLVETSDHSEGQESLPSDLHPGTCTATCAIPGSVLLLINNLPVWAVQTGYPIYIHSLCFSVS